MNSSSYPTYFDSFANSFNSGIGMFNNSRKADTYAKYGGKEEEAKYKALLAKLASAQAQANVAPEYYQGQADYMKNNAGISGLNLQYMPQNEQMKMGSYGSSEGLKNLQKQMLLNKLSRAEDYSPQSNLGKTIADSQYIMSQYPANSPQAMAAKQVLATIGQPKSGMTVFDPTTGNPLVSTGQKGGGLYGGGGNTYVDPQTGQIISSLTNAQRSREQKSVASEENLKQWAKPIIKYAGNFQTVPQKAKLETATITNQLGLTQSELPANYAKGQSALDAAAEGFVNTYMLNSTNENVQMARKIMEPRRGETTSQYQSRLVQQLKQFSDAQNRSYKRQAQGVVVGNTNGSMPTQSPSLKDMSLEQLMQLRQQIHSGG